MLCYFRQLRLSKVVLNVSRTISFECAAAFEANLIWLKNKKDKELSIVCMSGDDIRLSVRELALNVNRKFALST